MLCPWLQDGVLMCGSGDCGSVGDGCRTLNGQDVSGVKRGSGDDCGLGYVGKTVGLERVENRGVPCCVTPISRCSLAGGPNCRTYPGSHFFVCKVDCDCDYGVEECW